MAQQLITRSVEISQLTDDPTVGLLSAKADSLEDAKIAAEQPQGYLSAAVPLLGQVGAAGTSKDQEVTADPSKDQVGAADQSEDQV